MIKTRFSPSPTGLLHLGNARAALLSALYAQQAQGTFLLRIEDTDAVRSAQKYTAQLQDDLDWLGIPWQEGPRCGGPHPPYFQSERHTIYNAYYNALESKGLAYPCFCTEQELALNRKLQLSRGQAPRYPGTCRKLTPTDIAQRITQGQRPALRFHVPAHMPVVFNDLIKGEQHFNSSDVGDFIIRRAEGTASFMFCNAIDDSLMGVTHVIRGEDHLTNTPRQLLILQALALRTPHYGHLPLIIGMDGSRLSKRHGSFSLQDFREQGYLAPALLNYLARLGHTYDAQNLLGFEELAADLQLDKVSRSAARFDSHQLLHWQKEAVVALTNSDVWRWLSPHIQQIVPLAAQPLFADLMRLNIHFPTEAKHWADILFCEKLNFSAEQLAILQGAGKPFFQALAESAQKNGVDIQAIFTAMKTTFKISGKHLFMPVRMALTGQLQGPELAVIATLLGAEKLQKRFLAAAEAIT